MGEESAISWTDDTFNPWIGCAKVGPGCDHCYADAQQGTAGRYKRATWGGPGLGPGTRVRTSAANWKDPLKWERKQAALWGLYHANPDDFARPPAHFVFCASLADVFDNEIETSWLRDLFDLIHETPNLTWLLLTKRIGLAVPRFRAATALDSDYDPLSDYWPRNAALMATMVNQEEFDRDWPKLEEAERVLKPAFTGISMEPLLGPINMRGRRPGWVITGGETTQLGARGRPAAPNWFREIRDQCAATGIPYHHKQNGEWAEGISVPSGEPGTFAFGDYATGPKDPLSIVDQSPRMFALFGARTRMTLVGKKAAGRLLDGVEHNARPEVRL